MVGEACARGAPQLPVCIPREFVVGGDTGGVPCDSLHPMRWWPWTARVLLVAPATAAALLTAELVARVWLAPDAHWFQPVFRQDVDVGYTLQPGDHGVVLGADLRVNRDGYRGADWPEKAPGSLRVAVVGDSHAFGYGVREDAALPAVLEARLGELLPRPVEVLNFAVPGYSARQERAVLERKVIPRSPDAVVLVLCDNDERPDLWVDGDGWLRGGPPRPDASAPGCVHGPFLPSGRLGWLRYSRLLGYVKLQMLRAGMERTPSSPGWNRPVEAGPVPEVLRREVYEPARRMVEVCRASRVAVVVALFGVDPAHRTLLACLARDLGVATVDLITLFPESRSWDDLNLKFGLGWDPHLGEEAHARWGQALAQALAGELGRRD